MKDFSFFCTTCPQECALTVTVGDNNEVLQVRGNRCPRGEAFGRQEIICPQRVLTTTVLLSSASFDRLLPVRSNIPFARSLHLQAMQLLKTVCVKAPVAMGDVIVKNILGSGADIIACSTHPAATASLPLECVVTDLDGSLVGHNQVISPQDLAAVEQLRRMGIPFFVMTGRHPCMCKRIAATVGTQLPFVCNNGGTLYDFSSRKSLHDTLIPEKIAVAFWDWCQKNHYMCYVFTDSNAYVNSNYRDPDYPDKLMLRIAQGDDTVRFDPITAGFSPQGKRVTKLLVPNMPPEAAARLQQEVDPEYLLEISYSENNFADVTRAGADKGSALEMLARSYGFDLKKTLAMGDNLNDLKMLQLAGWPVATGNAIEQAKQLACFVTTDCCSSPLSHALHALFPDFF